MAEKHPPKRVNWFPLFEEISKENVWHQNKIKGGLAEAACRQHFESVGYNVDNFGIEHIAPHYAKLISRNRRSDYISNFIGIVQRMPDFIVSRVISPKESEYSTTADAILVDAKYLENADLAKMPSQYSQDYKDLRDSGAEFLIYVVSRKLYSSTNSKENYEGYVALGYYGQEKEMDGKTFRDPDGIWGTALSNVFTTNFPSLFDGKHPYQNFRTAYSDIVGPALTEIFYPPGDPQSI